MTRFMTLCLSLFFAGCGVVTPGASDIEDILRPLHTTADGDFYYCSIRFKEVTSTDGEFAEVMDKPGYILGYTAKYEFQEDCVRARCSKGGDTFVRTAKKSNVARCLPVGTMMKGDSLTVRGTRQYVVNGTGWKLVAKSGN